MAMSEPELFTIAVAQADIDDLASGCTARWPADPGNPGGRYEATRDFMDDLVHYWADTYDWRAIEADMNRYEHYRVSIDGIPIHFQRVRGTGPNPMPLDPHARLALDVLGFAQGG